ncbi:MAG: hypothetical protein HYS98_06650 [Deltaproteobacteria bacterium]|nr:hypothetical protein [Deltaproteobacteria bacterium]
MAKSTSIGSDGGGGANLDAFSDAHDFIDVFIKSKTRIFGLCASLYEKGLSLREVAAHTRIPKTTIRETLIEMGMSLRNFSNGGHFKDFHTSPKRPGVTPYGYAWLEGKLVVDPREYKRVLEILQLWQSGKNYSAIVKHLNGQNLPTRFGKSWTQSVVRPIIGRNLKQKQTDRRIENGTQSAHHIGSCDHGISSIDRPALKIYNRSS